MSRPFYEILMWVSGGGSERYQRDRGTVPVISDLPQITRGNRDQESRGMVLLCQPGKERPYVGCWLRWLKLFIEISFGINYTINLYELILFIDSIKNGVILDCQDAVFLL
jgi:hypothetical protein